jgi:hypothetical protein
MEFKALDLLKSYDYLGKNELSNGAVLVGKAPHIASQAWLHRIFAPLTIDEIDELQKDCKQIIPLDYKKFLFVTNGLGVFNTELSLYGKRTNYIRNVENAAGLPFDITTPNTLERIKNLGDNKLIIGSYFYDGSKLYIDNVTSKVHLCDRYDATSLYEWPSFDEMLDSEIKRLVTLFDKLGRQIDENRSTLPINR